jgi:hypothetical protein
MYPRTIVQCVLSWSDTPYVSWPLIDGTTWFDPQACSTNRLEKDAEVRRDSLPTSSRLDAAGSNHQCKEALVVKHWGVVNTERHPLRWTVIGPTPSPIIPMSQGMQRASIRCHLQYLRDMKQHMTKTFIHPHLTWETPRGDPTAM